MHFNVFCGLVLHHSFCTQLYIYVAYRWHYTVDNAASEGFCKRSAAYLNGQFISSSETNEVREPAGSPRKALWERNEEKRGIQT